MAGDSRYGGNGSIYMETRYGGKVIDERDPEHAQDFDVDLLYETSPDGATRGNPSDERTQKIVATLRKLAADAAAAADKISGGASSVQVKTSVPVVARPSKPTTQWEITLKW